MFAPLDEAHEEDDQHDVGSVKDVAPKAGAAIVFWVTFLLFTALADQVGIDSKVLLLAFGLIVGGSIGGLALAFGLGARVAVSNLIAARNIGRSYQPGQLIQVDGIQGRIIQINQGAVILQTAEGSARVPGKYNSKGNFRGFLDFYAAFCYNYSITQHKEALWQIIQLTSQSDLTLPLCNWHIKLGPSCEGPFQSKLNTGLNWADW